MYVNHPYERTDKIISSHLARGVRGNMFHVEDPATCEMYACVEHILHAVR